MTTPDSILCRIYNASHEKNAMTDSNRARIAELADQCVKCGLCVPVCPTYRVAQIEAESPRGRIAFAAVLAGNPESVSESMVDHLDRCLACMTCERVCPSHVRYSELIVATRAELARRGRSRASRLLEWLVRHPLLLRAVMRVANVPFVRAFVREAPTIPPLPRLMPVAGKTESRGRVGLFLGCVASLSDRDVHAGAKHLLEALGYDVVIPASSGCCGALTLHNGDADAAAITGRSTRDAFADVDTVLVSASGCFGTLRDHTFAGKNNQVREIHEFLHSDSGIEELRFAPLHKKIALHTPCTQANVARADGAIQSLLARIPELEVISLPTEARCCGAAGDYFLRHPDTANALRAEKLDQVASVTPDFLVTSNVGCRIFLANGLRQRANHVRVIHPIVLLAQQLQN
jgi:glycolate oxidase iron-sulfur subunit